MTVHIEQMWPTPIGMGHIPVSAALKADVSRISDDFNTARRAAIKKSHGVSSTVRFQRRNILDLGIPSIDAFAEVAVDLFREYLKVGLKDSEAHQVDLLVRGLCKTYEPGTRILPHYDHDAGFSMIYYLTDCNDKMKVEACEHQGESGIIFVDPRGFKNSESAMQESIKYVRPNAGDFVIYPGYLMHETDHNLTGSDRKILVFSFNIDRGLATPKSKFYGVKTHAH